MLISISQAIFENKFSPNAELSNNNDFIDTFKEVLLNNNIESITYLKKALIPKK